MMPAKHKPFTCNKPRMAMPLFYQWLLIFMPAAKWTRHKVWMRDKADTLTFSIGNKT
jgi:hypothetical protein